jgi:hypothetical protein
MTSGPVLKIKFSNLLFYFENILPWPIRVMHQPYLVVQLLYEVILHNFSLLIPDTKNNMKKIFKNYTSQHFQNSYS